MVGRRMFEPTDEQRKQVEAMSGYGVPQDDIATVLDIDPKTLRLHFRRELDLGSVRATAKVGESLYKQATGGNVAAAIFWMKARAGWRETQVHEINNRALSAEQVEARIAELIGKAGTAEPIGEDE